jgi:hypothetical protein
MDHAESTTPSCNFMPLPRKCGNMVVASATTVVAAKKTLSGSFITVEAQLVLDGGAGLLVIRPHLASHYLGRRSLRVGCTHLLKRFVKIVLLLLYKQPSRDVPQPGRKNGRNSSPLAQHRRAALPTLGSNS